MAEKRQFGEIKDIRKARMTLVRQESLDEFGTASHDRRRSIQRRVFKNHYVTTKKAEFEVSEAEIVNRNTKLRI